MTPVPLRYQCGRYDVLPARIGAMLLLKRQYPILLALLGTSLISGCEKDFEIQPRLITSPKQLVAVGGSTSASAYTRLVAWDYFKGFGSSSQTDSACYTDDTKATCSRRLDWFGASNNGCSESVAHLKLLDKCTWTIWDGFSFWDQSFNVAYKPSAVTVKDGILKLQPRVRPESEGPFQCGPPATGLKRMSSLPRSEMNSLITVGKVGLKSTKTRDPLSDDWYDINCRIVVGGIDSKDRGNGKTQGRNIRNGRMQIIARWTNINGIWPALWTWRGDVGKGFPYTDTGHATGSDYYGEIDIMESVPEGTSNTRIFQTYHVWEKEHYSSGARHVTLDFTQWNTYGVERTDSELYFIVNGAYVARIVDGGTDSRNHPTMRIDNIAEYLIMSMGPTTEAGLESWAALNSAAFEVKSVEFYEKP